MSGPIVRKYGFPNFEQIFGKREIQHGVDESDAPDDARTTPPASEKAAEEPAPKTPPESK